MPSETLEHVLVRAKDRKSSKKCKESRCHKPKPCEVDCCVPDCNPDCCTPAFQRLDKLRNVWFSTSYTNSVPVTDVSGSAISTVYNRAGTLITDVSPIKPCSWGLNELAAYAFVNEVRYLNFEECGKLDQVTGWSVDIQSGNLYFYQNLPELGLTTCDSRAELLETTTADFTPQIKQKLSAMEPFWKLSLKAVERVRENPKTEGNICEIKDKCGNRFLVAINRADSQTSTTSVCEYNSRYSIVVVKLC